jgi:tellurite resistance protein TehA-like permease
MAHGQSRPSNEEIEDRIQQVGKYSRAVHAGLLVIVSAFLLAVVGVLPANMDSVSQAIDAILMPLTFVGLGVILYGIGMHLHLMHLNLVRQLQPNANGEAGGDDDSPG